MNRIYSLWMYNRGGAGLVFKEAEFCKRSFPVRTRFPKNSIVPPGGIEEDPSFEDCSTHVLQPF